MLFEHGLSSRTEASLTSGRGVGLPMVRAAVEKLNGSITFSTTSRGKGKGTRFDVSVPITPTLFRALTWRWGQYYLALPLFVVDKVIQLPVDKKRGPLKKIIHERHRLDVVNLARIFDLSGADAFIESAVTAAIISWGGQRIAVSLPSGVTEQELIMQSLSSLTSFRTVIGIAVSEDSLPIVILNYRTLFESS